MNKKLIEATILMAMKNITVQMDALNAAQQAYDQENTEILKQCFDLVINLAKTQIETVTAIKDTL